MAAPDLDTAEGMAMAIGALDPDFHGLLERKEVSQRVQGRLSNANVKSISRFAALGDTRADLRTFCTGTLALDRAVDVVEIAGVVDAWQASKSRMESRHQAEAEASISSMPNPINKVEAQDLRMRFEQMHYKLEDKVTPASSTLELVFDQVESGEWKALSLIQFLSKDDTEAEVMGAMIDKSGTVKIKKGYGESKPPKTPEELRQRLRLVGHAYIMAQLKFPHKAVLQQLTPNHFNKFCDYLLGEQVMGLRAKDEEGTVVSAPSLELVLSYEFQIRKEMVKLMNAGEPMREALDRAMKDGVVKERFFLTPAAYNALTSLGGKRDKSRSVRRDRWNYSNPSSGSWGGKGKAKGGKGKKGGGKSLHSKTPDGREICYAWNNKEQRCRHKCGRVHVCQICFGQHPAHACKGPSAGGEHRDTAGGGGSKEK